jgi:hypothetical protein
LAVISTLLAVGYVVVSTALPWTDRAILGVGVFTAGFFLVLTMLAIAEVLKLVIDIEHNTRVAANRSAAMSSAAATTAMASADGDGAAVAGRTNRLDELDEETAEAALLRGH